MYRIESRASQRIIDFGVLSIAFWTAFLLRFDADIPAQYVKRALFLWPYVAILQYIVLAFFRVPSFSWRYIGLREVNRIAWAIGVAGLVLLGIRLTAGAFNTASYAGYVAIPIGVIAIDTLLALTGLAGVRALRRLLTERHESVRRPPARDAKRTLFIGAGRAGLMVAREVARCPDLGIDPVGFLDDDPTKVGLALHGVSVLGTTEALPGLVSEGDVQQAIITIANASGKAIRRIRERCSEVGLHAKIVPGIHELIDGKLNLSRLREVSIEDLLRREVVELDRSRTAGFLSGRCVVVTGAGGSIGSEICRQVARFRPAKLVLIERSEPSLFAIHHEMQKDLPDLDMVACLCDVTDPHRIDVVFGQHAPNVVFHAAAHKHVPMMELNPGEALKNNVFGTRTLADAADRHEVGDFVLISTDKAVNPSSIMGATKRLAEMYVQALAESSSTSYVSVRFGNVLGSTGSVVPIFKEQIARGGPVTVTHPDMRRYFMTIPEATALVLQAAALGKRGEIFLLDMGEPVRIVDLAADLIRLSGLEPGEDVKIEFTGVRPGEKLFEELCFDPEAMDRTRHPKIFVVTHNPEPLEQVNSDFSRLEALCDGTEPAGLRAVLRSILPEMVVDANHADAAQSTNEEPTTTPVAHRLQPATR